MSFIGFGGSRLAAECCGSSEDPTVLILDGGNRMSERCSSVAAALAGNGRHVVSICLCRDSTCVRWEMNSDDLDANIQDLRAVLAQLPDRPVVIGISVGAVVALAALAGSSESLATGLIVVDAGPWLNRDALDRISLRMSASPLELARTEDQAEGVGAPAALSLPTLVIQGEGNDVFYENAKRLAASIPGAEFLRSERGDLVAVDRSEAPHAALIEFLERRIPRVPIAFKTGADHRTLRDAFGSFATGVTIVTTLGADGEPIGLTANSFSSVSLDPPLILFCLAKASSNLKHFVESEHFAVNVLHIGQQSASQRFARKKPHRFSVGRWEQWDSGVPILADSAASFECRNYQTADAGDHIVFFGYVTRAQFEPRRDPLLYFRGKYRRIHLS